MSRVLVVDDDRGIRELLRVALEAEGYAVSTLSDGRGVVEWLAERREPCVALMDLSMPHMTGWEVCARLAANPAALGAHQLVILTAEPLSAGECPAPALRVVAKPFNLDALCALVAGLFALPAMSASAASPSSVAASVAR
ncbi:MAG TPA: response regulator [Ktedonobacterales bacterium]